jgi:hypothetical protein
VCVFVFLVERKKSIVHLLLLGRSLLWALHNIGVTSISDSHAGHTEVLTTSSSEVNVGTRVVVHLGAGQHSVVLDLRLLKRRAVVRDNEQDSLSLTKCLHRALVSEVEFTGLDDKGEVSVDALHGLFLFSIRKTREEGQVSKQE